MYISVKMRQIQFLVLILTALLLPSPSVSPQAPRYPSGRPSPTTIDSYGPSHVRDPVLDELVGFIQVKASTQTNSKPIAFDLTKLQTYLKEVDHQLTSLQAQVSSLFEAKQTLDIIKNAFGGNSGRGCDGFKCPPCPNCDRRGTMTCPPFPPCPPPPPVPACPSVPKRPSRNTTTTTSTTTKSPDSDYLFDDY